MEERIQRLETSLRRLRVLAAGLVLLLVVGLAAAFTSSRTTQDVLRVRGLVIVDGEGRERILIGAPVPEVDNRIRTDSARARAAWAGRYPDPDTYMGYYADYRHATNGILILDEEGYDRVALGDPVPDPNIGRRIGPATGVVINDAEGFESSGYGVIDVDGRERVVLGLDAAHGEALTLAVHPEGRIGVTVDDGQRSLFLGAAPAGDRVVGAPDGPFSGLIFREGDEVTRVLRGRD